MSWIKGVRWREPPDAQFEMAVVEVNGYCIMVA